jgi:predicted TIM-barrel fold metal-dependent hydrolase
MDTDTERTRTTETTAADGTGSTTAERLDGAIDAHVHLMPPKLLRAIREVLASEEGWSFSHPVERAGIERTLHEAGVTRYLALPYTHRPGMARELNEWVIEAARGSAMRTPFATVHADDEVRAVVREAFEAGARGLKFQCLVQKSGPDDSRLDPAFELAAEYDRPITFHAGTAPTFEASPHVGADAFESFLESYPDVRACAAHLGTYEVEAFFRFAHEYDNAFLDTTMALSARSPEYLGFDPATITDGELDDLSTSIMYGSDVPNLPYAYADERAGILARDLPTATLTDLFGRTAERFLGER